ncbi:hypothetical protein XU18_1863 [Perkinsela sp. CCAP 1560/4]|nr:hypothetical protein XU18_1863 [Perkinsela sp. CCAP 1560/4]|eukprot:KNH07331.1 hypothetical protein XU18_1863 [Perkinsela sp. CCAP 1560/4]
MSTLRFLRFAFVGSADPSLGRLDYTPLSQQALMEMFIAGIENREIICGSREKPTDVTEWKGFQVDNETENVVEVV